MTFTFMSLSPEPENCLANMAALLILNDFDNIIGFVFELRVKRKFPKLHMLDDLLKDQFSLKSQNVADTFTNLFLFLNLIYLIISYLLLQESCTYKEQFYYDMLKGKAILGYS